jgi:hypothetical protein
MYKVVHIVTTVLKDKISEVTVYEPGICDKTASGLHAGRVAGTNTVRRIPPPVFMVPTVREKIFTGSRQNRSLCPNLPPPPDLGTGRGLGSILRTHK